MATRPLKVCFVTGEYPPDEGGVADYTACLSAALAAQGAVVDVVTARGSGAARPANGAGDAGEGRHPAVHRVVGGWGWGSLAAVGRRVARLAPDVVHVQYQAAAFGMRPAIHALPWWLRATRSGAQAAVTFHDLRVPYLFPKAGPVRRAALRLLARGARMVVATNAEDYAELGVDGLRGRLELIPIGSNIPDAPPEGYDRDAWRAAAGIGAGAAVVAYFGFLNASKGGLTLAEALARLRAAGRDARLVMIGGAVGASDPTNAAYLAAFRAELAARGLDDAVVWTGHVAPPGVSGWLHAADVVALPYGDGASYRRGSLLAALEHGRPVVTTLPAPLTGGLLPALVDGEAVLLVPPGDAGALAAALAAVLDQDALAARLSAGARSLATRFGWTAIAARHLGLYRSVLAEAWEGDG